jgi:hypothetical protein
MRAGHVSCRCGRIGPPASLTFRKEGEGDVTATFVKYEEGGQCVVLRLANKGKSSALWFVDQPWGFVFFGVGGLPILQVNGGETNEVRLKCSGAYRQTDAELHMKCYAGTSDAIERAEDLARRAANIDLSRLRLVLVSVDLPPVTNAVDTQRSNAIR